MRNEKRNYFDGEEVVPVKVERENQKRGVRVTLPLPVWAKPDTVLGTVESAKENKSMRVFEKNMKDLKSKK